MAANIWSVEHGSAQNPPLRHGTHIPMKSGVRVETASAPIAAVMASVAVAAGLLTTPVPAEAQIRANGQAAQNQPAVGRPAGRSNRVLPATGRYVSESGETFVFDRSGARPLFRFESRNETWVLRASPAPRRR